MTYVNQLKCKLHRDGVIKCPRLTEETFCSANVGCNVPRILRVETDTNSTNARMLVCGRFCRRNVWCAEKPPSPTTSVPNRFLDVFFRHWKNGLSTATLAIPMFGNEKFYDSKSIPVLDIFSFFRLKYKVQDIPYIFSLKFRLTRLSHQSLPITTSW